MSLPRQTHRLVPPAESAEVTVKCPHGFEVTADTGDSPEEKRSTAQALLLACPRCAHEADGYLPESAA